MRDDVKKRNAMDHILNTVRNDQATLNTNQFFEMGGRLKDIVNPN